MEGAENTGNEKTPTSEVEHSVADRLRSAIQEVRGESHVVLSRFL
jgi:hypothetical protein